MITLQIGDLIKINDIKLKKPRFYLVTKVLNQESTSQYPNIGVFVTFFYMDLEDQIIHGASLWLSTVTIYRDGQKIN